MHLYQLFAVVDLVKLGANNSVEFAPESIVTAILTGLVAAAISVGSLIVLSVGVWWLFGFLRERSRASSRLTEAEYRAREASIDYGPIWEMEERVGRYDHLDEE